MIDRILDASGSSALVPIFVVVALAWAVPGLFAFARSRSQNRRDFLELWKENPSPDDLWLETSIRHLFGEWLPADLIRSLMRSPQGGRALSEVSAAWEWLDYSDETGEISWKHRRYSTARRRRLLVVIKSLGYFILMSVSLYMMLQLLRADIAGLSHAMWVFPIILGAIALKLAIESLSLSDAGKSVVRWLGLP